MSDSRTTLPPLGRTRENLRQHNLSVVLRTLHEAGAVPRTFLTSVTGLNRSTISDLVGELVSLGLATEQESVASGVGRPSYVVEPCSQVVAFAVNPETDATTVGVVSFDGRLLQRVRYPTTYQPDPASVTKTTARLISELRATLPADARIAGVGAAVPGQIRVRDGVVRFAPHLDWVEVPFGPTLAQATGLPVWVDNDSACTCVAERTYGAGRGVNNSVFVLAGSSGIGGGIVADGRLLRGASGYAGELGHIPFHASRVVDRGGVSGTLEATVRRDDLLEIFKIDAATDEELDIDITSTKDRRIVRTLHQQIDDLGRALGGFATTFNPDSIILGGFLNSLFKFDQARLLNALRHNSIGAAHDSLIVKGAELGSAGVLIGAAELAFSPILESPAGAKLVAVRR